MFQGSFFTSPEPRCHDHPKQLITHICMDVSCKQNPFICSECMTSAISKQRHYGHDLKIKLIDNAIQQISSTLNLAKKPIENMYKTLLNSTLSNNSSQRSGSTLNLSQSASNPPTLIKYQQQKEQHCQSIRKHIQSIKYSLSQEIKSLLASYQKCLQQELDYVHKQLEKYYENYRQYFQHFCYKIAPVVIINKQLKYFDSKQNISLKIMAQIDSEERNKWFNEVKKAVYAANKVLADYDGEFNKLQSISTKTNEMIDLLPRTCGPQNQQIIRKIMQNSAKDIFRSVVKFGQIAHYYKDSSKSYTTISNGKSEVNNNDGIYRGLQKSHSMQVDNGNHIGKSYDYGTNITKI